MVRVCRLYMLRDQFRYLIVFQRERERERDRQTEKERERERGEGGEENSRYPLSETVTGLDKLT